MTQNKTYSVFAKDDLVPVEERVKSFSTLLDTIDNLSDKKKELWKQIYANAIIDRHNASMCYSDLMMHVVGKPVEHAIHAPNLAKYIEKMSKATDQLIRLAELIAEAEAKDEQIDPEEIYGQLGTGSRKDD
jgi:hypothetical protein